VAPTSQDEAKKWEMHAGIAPIFSTRILQRGVNPILGKQRYSIIHPGLPYPTREVQYGGVEGVDLRCVDSARKRLQNAGNDFVGSQIPA